MYFNELLCVGLAFTLMYFICFPRVYQLDRFEICWANNSSKECELTAGKFGVHQACHASSYTLIHLFNLTELWHGLSKLEGNHLRPHLR